MNLQENIKIPHSNEIWKKRQNILVTFLEDKLILKLSDGIHLINFEDILYLSAESNYCKINFVDGSKKLSSKTLKHFENSLINKGFLRVHASHLVNLKKVVGLCNNEGLCLKLTNGSIIPVSRSYKEKIFKGIL